MKPQIKGDWIEVPKGGYKVNSVTGHIVNLKTDKNLKIYRDKRFGVVRCLIPKNEGVPGIGKGRLHQVGRIILAGIHGGAPHPNPRCVFALPKDGNKWNIRPSNLEWVLTRDYNQQRVMRNDVRVKLNAATCNSLKDIASRLDKKGPVDFDALGYTFSICATEAYRTINNKAWSFINNYCSSTEQTSEFNRNLFLKKVLDSIALFERRDEELAEYIEEGPQTA